MRRTAGTVLVGGLLLGVAACSTEPLGKDTGSIDPTTPEAAQADPAAAPGGEEEPAAAEEGPTTRPIQQVTKDVGTRQQPMTVGTELVDDDWTVTLGQPHDGWEEIRSADEYAERPEEGTAYWLVPVTVTYTGEDSAEPWSDLQFGYVTDDGRSYIDWCPVIVPEDLMEVDALFTDATVEANVCLQIPADTDGLWTVSSDWGDPVFFTGQAGQGDD